MTDADKLWLTYLDNVNLPAWFSDSDVREFRCEITDHFKQDYIKVVDICMNKGATMEELTEKFIYLASIVFSTPEDEYMQEIVRTMGKYV